MVYYGLNELQGELLSMRPQRFLSYAFILLKVANGFRAPVEMTYGGEVQKVSARRSKSRKRDRSTLINQIIQYLTVLLKRVPYRFAEF